MNEGNENRLLQIAKAIIRNDGCKNNKGCQINNSLYCFPKSLNS